MKYIVPSLHFDQHASVIPFDLDDRTILLVTTSRYGDADAIARIKSALPGSEIVSLSHPATGHHPADNHASATPTLTHRQQEILGHLLSGLSNKEIARKLGLSHFTVRNHVSNILRMMGYSCRRTMRSSLAVEHVRPDYLTSLVA